MREQILEIQKKYPDFNQVSHTFPDLKSIASREGVDVYVLDLPVFSCLCYFRTRPFILLSDRLNNIQKTFSLAHELGHYFLHKNCDLCFLNTRLSTIDGIEKERISDSAVPAVLDPGNESSPIKINFDNQKIQKESFSPSPQLILTYMDVFGRKYKTITRLKQLPVPPYYFHPTIGEVKLQIPWKWF